MQTHGGVTMKVYFTELSSATKQLPQTLQTFRMFFLLLVYEKCVTVMFWKNKLKETLDTSETRDSPNIFLKQP